MNLIVDFGNTRIKLAFFQNNVLMQKHIFESEQELILFTQALSSNVSTCIICSVTNAHLQFISALEKKIKIILFKKDSVIPLQNLYKSASTLGSDRLAVAVGGYTLFPNQNVLTIDAGTCIKYNFVNQNNEYVGGAISPGIQMRLKAMNSFTHALPLIEFNENYEILTGTSTHESILTGAAVGAVCEVQSMIERYNTTYKNLKIILTGGNANYLCKQLKNRFFAEPNLLFIGLNTILNCN